MKKLLAAAALAVGSLAVAVPAANASTPPPTMKAYEQINCSGGVYQAQVIWYSIVPGKKGSVQFGLHTFATKAQALAYGSSLGATTFYVQPGC